MSPSRPFILRPVATSLLMLAIVLAGIVGLRFLPLSALPQVDYPTIQVQTLYPGASPEVMSQTVTASLERQFGQMAGLQRMSATSAAGVSIVTLQFSLGITLDVAEQEVQAAINASGSLLPADLPAPPVYAKVNPADAPVLTLAITSDTLPLTEVQNLVNTRLVQKISQVSGVGLVTLSGGQRPAVRIQADTQALSSYGIALDTLRSAISSANANSASVEHVEIELMLAVVLVVLVIFAFLHSLRATVIASMAVPISLIGTFGAMYLLGYSLNNLSLMALTIATGFVVDDAIVMIENIARHLEMASNVSAQA